MTSSNNTTRRDYRHARAQRLRRQMERLGIGAVLLRQPANFAWYTGGADNRVNHAQSVGVASVLVTPTEEYVIATNIEARRMREEQTPDIEVVEHPWFVDMETTIRDVIGGTTFGADAPTEGARDVGGEIAPVRYLLDAEAIERYRQVGRDAALAMAEAVEALEPGMTEYQGAALLESACRRHKLFCPVALVAADERIASYRHPIPQGATIKSRVMVVCCAERGGLYANLTRIVSFEPLDAETQRRQELCDVILRRMRHEATVPGRTLADAFADCQRFYAEAGFPQEWRLHHQGGLSGYASREVVATPSTHLVIEPGQAFAWNPSITGAKAEETFILTEAGPEVI